MDSEDWKQYRRHGQEKRAVNRKRGAERLEKEGIPFRSKNGGAHLLIDDRDSGTSISYWPGTGKWIDHGVDANGRGINSLLRHING